MQRLLNDEWSLAVLPYGSKREDAVDFRPVDLPHDALISDENDLYKTCDLWYRRKLRVPEEQLGLCWLLAFDGVYMDCDVLLNGKLLRTHHHGYTAFTVALKPALRAGENELLVHIRHLSPNTRWYSGAGIFRDVQLLVLPEAHIVPDSVQAHAERVDGQRWRFTVSCELTGAAAVTYTLKDMQGEAVLTMPADSFGFATAEVCEPALWSCDRPVWYTLEAACEGQVIIQRTGFREITLNPDRGLLLNGETVKLKGVCLHHDLGALGAAFNEKAARRQLLLMQDMGANALRTSHNPPARQVLDLCDELGILVVDEFTDMWHHPKTSGDYARFFDADCRADVADWIRRDRNHPCVCMWSIGNEIADTMENPYRVDLSVMLRDEVLRHDRTRAITMASNYMAWEGGQRCSEVLDAQGYNYAEKYYAQHHREHPDWVIYGSETASTLASRGIYHFPMSANILSDEDLQCSALGNSATSWGTQDIQRCIYDDLNTPFSLGQFIWTGTDYIGEPTPYHTRSSYFGMADTAGYPKDSFYRFRAGWSDRTTLHIGVPWCWNPGQMIDVPVMTNCPAVELFLNGESLGRKAVNTHSAEGSLPVWQVPYTSGVLLAVGYGEDGRELAREERRSFGDSCALRLTAETATLLADGRDMAFVTVEAVDDRGNPVENAVDRVHITVSGAGRLMGLDNGDSTDADGYKTTSRHLFSGKLLAMIGSNGRAGEIKVIAEAPGLAPCTLCLTAEPAEAAEGVSCREELCPERSVPQDRPVRAIRLTPLGGTGLNPACPSVSFRVEPLPADADAQEISFRVTNPAGITSPCAEVVREGDIVTVTAKGDGELYLRATACNGADHARIISVQGITVSGMGTPYLDPYQPVCAGLYDIAQEITSGNEQGISFSPDSVSIVGFSKVDFGKAGSDRLTLPIFALDGKPYDMEMYLGDPREGAPLFATLHYQKPSIWNTYQEESWTLPARLTGVQTICFRMEHKVHLKSFVFERQSRAWLRQTALDADQVYGDSFIRDGEAVREIGNNVSLCWNGLDFGDAGRVRLVLDGRTPLEKNPITLHLRAASGEDRTELLEFAGGDRHIQTFEIPVPQGEADLSFVFLPGSSFDFWAFVMEKIG